MNNICTSCAHCHVCRFCDCEPMTECKEYAPRQVGGKELAHIIGFSLNTFSFDSGGFVDEMLREHRTIQQNFVREMILSYLHALSQVRNFDDRNAASVNLAKAVMERLTDEEQRLPYI